MLAQAPSRSQGRLTILTISGLPIWATGEGKGMPSVYRAQKAFVDAGHEAHFVFSGKGSGEWVYEGIHVHQFGVWCPTFPPSSYWLHRVSTKLCWVAFVLIGTVQAIRVSRRVKPTVVYGYSSYGVPVAYVVGKVFRIANISRLFGTFLMPCLDSWISTLKKCEEVLAFKTPCNCLILTDNGTQGNRVAQRLRVPAERVRFWMNGVDREAAIQEVHRESLLDAFHLPKHREIILWVSRLVSWKRADRLIRAVPEIISRRPEAGVVIIGNGDEKNSLERLSDELGVSDHVHFLGAQNHAAVRRFLSVADVFVSLFDLSNVSNAVLEAMISGRCIVTLNTGDTAMVIRHLETGVLVQPDELSSLPEITVRLLEDEPLRARLGASARAHALTNFWTWEERMKAELDLVQGLVANGRG